MHNDQLFNQRKRVLWMEQPELWNSQERTSSAAKAVAEDEIGEAVSTKRFFDSLAKHTLRRASEKATISEASEVYAERGNSVKMVDIAKFLQVNRAVDGACEMGSRFSLPRGSFEARCSLWRGSSVGTPFMMGC